MVYFKEKRTDKRNRVYFLVTDKPSVSEPGELMGIEGVRIILHDYRQGIIYPQANELNLDLKIIDKIANYIVTDRPVEGYDNLFHTEKCVD